MADLMNNDCGRLQRVEDPFERGIEFLDESQVRAPARRVLRKIETRHTNQIDAREIVSPAQRAADREVGWVQFLQATKVSLRWPRL